MSKGHTTEKKSLDPVPYHQLEMGYMLIILSTFSVPVCLSKIIGLAKTQKKKQDSQLQMHKTMFSQTIPAGLELEGVTLAQRTKTNDWIYSLEGYNIMM